MIKEFVSSKDAKGTQRRKRRLSLRLCAPFAPLRETNSFIIVVLQFILNTVQIALFAKKQHHFTILIMISNGVVEGFLINGSTQISSFHKLE